MFVVIGTTTVDILVRGIPGPATSGDGFRSGNLVFCQEPLLMLVGGNGANSAYALGRLGAEVALVSSVGRDHLGDWLAGRLCEQGVQLSGLIRQRDLATSSSTILLEGAENQGVYHHKGATDALEVTAAHEALFRGATVLLASSYPLHPLMRAGGFARALRLAHAAGAITAADIGPAIGEPVKTVEIEPVLPSLEYLIANAHELRVCTDMPDWETAAADLLARGCRCVVVKRGRDGVSLRSPEATIDIPAFPCSAHITVGAGDAFNAGFLYARQAGQPLPEALRFGSAVAALVVGGRRGVLSAPTLAEVDELLQSTGPAA